MVQSSDAGEQTGATPEGAAPAQATQPPLSETVREAVREENSRMWAAVRQQLVPLQQQAATVQDLATAYQNLTGDARKTQLLVERLMEGSTSPEEVQGILKTETERQEAEALKNERDYFRAELEAAYAAGETEDQKLSREFQTIYAPRAERMGKAEGLTWQETREVLPVINRGATAKDCEKWEVTLEAKVQAAADRKLKATKPPVAVPSGVAAGAGPPRSSDNFRNLSDWWRTHPNGR